MLVREIMSAPGYRVQSDASPATVMTLMVRARVTSLPVVDHDEYLVGIVSEVDLLRYRIQPDPRAHLRPTTVGGVPLPARVSDLMTPNPETTRETADLEEVARVFAGSSWKSLPVMRGSTLVGMLSRSDVLRALAHPDQEIEEEVTHRYAVLGRPLWAAHVTGGVVHVTGTADDRERDAATSLAAVVPGVRQVQHGTNGPVPANRSRPSWVHDSGS
jgi:CBS domain-containing protein